MEARSRGVGEHVEDVIFGFCSVFCRFKGFIDEPKSLPLILKRLKVVGAQCSSFFLFYNLNLLLVANPSA